MVESQDYSATQISLKFMLEKIKNQHSISQVREPAARNPNVNNRLADVIDPSETKAVP